MKLQLFCIAALFAFAPIVTAQSITPPATQASYDLLEELAGRIIGYGYDEPELMVGKLPTDRIKLEIPVPNGARVLGTSVRDGESFEVVLDVRADAKAILDFYRQKYQGSEDKGSQGLSRGGFLFSSGESQQRSYSQDTLLCLDKWSVSVTVYRLDAAIKDVRLRIDQYSCEFSKVGITLPNLLLPKEAQPSSGSSGFGDDISSSISFESKLTVLQVFEHYSAQLEVSKWKLSEKIALKSGMLATYEFSSSTGELWAALFTVVPAKGGLVTASIRAYPL